LQRAHAWGAKKKRVGRPDAADPRGTSTGEDGKDRRQLFEGVEEDDEDDEDEAGFADFLAILCFLAAGLAVVVEAVVLPPALVELVVAAKAGAAARVRTAIAGRTRRLIMNEAPLLF
jgi:hypothetical protein